MHGVLELQLVLLGRAKMSRDHEIEFDFGFDLRGGDESDLDEAVWSGDSSDDYDDDYDDDDDDDDDWLDDEEEWDDDRDI